MVNNCWLDDFFAFEHSPGYSVDVFILHVLVGLSFFVDSLEGDIFKLMQVGG